MLKRFFILVIGLISFMLSTEITPACGQAQLVKTDLRNGDLLFVGSSDSGFSGAINEVTQTEKQTHFSHIALLEKEEEKLWVMQAVSEGTERIPLAEFLKKRNGRKIIVYRIKSRFHPHFTKAIKRAKSMLGKPYNDSYVLNDSSYYCSSFVYFAFLKDAIFRLEPMTFKNPGTDQYNKEWVQYYRKLKLKIPEGKPGCNPNGMAASPKLKKVGEL